MNLAKLTLITLLFISPLFAQAQSLDQSSPSLHWKTLSNNFVQVIYPDFVESDAIYAANLIRHYAQYVGLTYGIEHPESITLILRAEMAEPNGFVTLGPRRSEWFSSSVMFPYVGSSEWLQTLSIHEYRHVIQYDFFKKGSVEGLRILFGDTGQSLGLFLGLHSWYFEGDAVWAETKYTDAGRGRSPRFLSRLKALILSGQTPTYDQFVNGTYANSIPNQYVYGYALVSHATQKFGERFWSDVSAQVADLPHPFRLYSSFKNVSGQDFYEFYDETMNELKKGWATDALPATAKTEFREYRHPFKISNQLYYLKHDLDSYWTLQKLENQKEEKVVSISFAKEISQLHVSKNKAVFAQFLPDSRYGYQNYSDLVLIDLESKSQSQITHHQRLYNPRLNANADRIIAAEFLNNNQWALSEFNLQGERVNQIELKDEKPAEAYYIDQRSAFVLLTSKTGHKSIVRVSLDQKRVVETVVPASRNNLYSLNVGPGGDLFFEAQYKGVNQIFKIDSQHKSFQCTQSKIGANTPSSDGETLQYADEDANGTALASVPLNACKEFALSELTQFHYLGDSPSDNLNHFTLQSFDDQLAQYTRNESQSNPEDYGDFDSRLFKPHSWSLLGGRGYELSATSDNYLRTLGLNAKVGYDTEEKRKYGELNFQIKKFYPVFNFRVGLRSRKVDYFGSAATLEWDEKGLGLSMAIPYVKKVGLSNFSAALFAEMDYLDTSDYQLENLNLSYSNRSFTQPSAGVSLAWSRDATYRSLIQPWLLSYAARFEKANSLDNDAYSSNRVIHQARLQTPGFFTNHGILLSAIRETQTASQQAYKFVPRSESTSSYILSRGYQYESVPGYQKWSANYLFPIAYPDLALGGWYYLRRIQANLFFDSTELRDGSNRPKYESYGAELELESNIFRRIPLTLGVRGMDRLRDHHFAADVYFSLVAGL